MYTTDLDIKRNTIVAPSGSNFQNFDEKSKGLEFAIFA